MPAGSVCPHPEKCNTILSLFSPSGQPCCQTGQSLFCWSVPTIQPAAAQNQPSIYSWIYHLFGRDVAGRRVTTFYCYQSCTVSVLLYRKSTRQEIHFPWDAVFCCHVIVCHWGLWDCRDMTDVICWVWTAFGVVQRLQLGIMRNKQKAFFPLAHTFFKVENILRWINHIKDTRK